MGEKDLWLKIGLIVMIVGLSISFIYPPQDKLKPGIDLGGGSSLLFEIDDSGEAGKRSDLAERVMEILKQRVDPGGSRNLVWRPIGRNRLEIQMPQPPSTQRQSRMEYEKAREALARTQISRTQILNMVAMPAGPGRDAAIDKLVLGVEARRPLLKTLTETIDRFNQLQATSQPAAAGTQPADSAKAKEMDSLFIRRNETLEKLLNTNLDPQVIGDLLDLDRKSEVRGQRIEQLKKDHPDLAGLIAGMVDKYEGWSKGKGMLDDPSDLMRMLRGAGKLEFRILAEKDSTSEHILSSKREYQEPVATYMTQLAKFGPRPQENDKFQWFEVAKPEENSIVKSSNYIVGDYLGRKYCLAYATEEMGLLNKGRDDWKLRQARPDRDRSGAMAVNFSLDNRGGQIFYKLTSENIERPLCIFLDDKAMSAATIREAINTDGQITGRFSMQEVQYLVNTLEAGVLPARLKEVPLQEKSVGPSLGATNIRNGLISSAIAFALVVAFMAIYYSYCGFVADLAVMLNLLITLGIMAFFGNTFTLPGIAGMVLTLGMAVDANVLIYERMREELQRGVSARMAIKLGYEKAFSAILDGNVTTILTALILAYLGSEEIKGFGQTLAIGLCVSMFTALFVTRQYFNVMIPATLNREETSRCWMGTLVLALLAGGFLGLGWLFNRGNPIALEESNLVGMGKFLGIVLASAIGLLVTMWLFRFVYRALGHQQANRIPMFKFLSKPNVNWMQLYRYFWAASCIIVVGGIVFSWQQLKFDPKAVLDIEFVGGTNVQIGLKEAFKDMTDEQVTERIVGKGDNDQSSSVGWLRYMADQVAGAKVAKLDENKFNIAPADEKLTKAQIEAALSSTLADKIARAGVTAAEQGVNVQFKSVDKSDSSDAATTQKAPQEGDNIEFTDVASVQNALQECATYIRDSAGKMRGVKVQLVQEETGENTTRKAFEIVTTETSKQLVAESLLASLGDRLEVIQPIEGKLVTDATRAPDGLFPIKQADRTIADVIGSDISGTAGNESAESFKGGLILVFANVQPTATKGDIEGRLKQMQLQPDFEGQSRDHQVIGLEADKASNNGPARYSKFAILTSDPTRPYVEDADNEQWTTQVAEPELKLAQAALASSQALQRVTSFAAQVATEAAIKAVIAIILSMIAIAIYVWVRFGSADFGVASIIALYHDVATTLSVIMLARMFHDTSIGHFLGLTDFRIDLTLVAALLTIVGYSINDTIVIFDRIRENRGRLATISSTLVNRSVNETLSRSIITSLTVFMTVVVMYIFGGDGIHGFAFAMIIGTLVGSYSTIAIAPPLMMRPKIMWMTAIILGSLTLMGLVTLVTSGKFEGFAVIVVAAVAVYGLYRVSMAYKGAKNLIMAQEQLPAQ